MRLLHLADVHLDAPYTAFGERAARRRADVLAAFERLPRVAGDEGVHAVLIAGDLFDGPQPDAEVMPAVRETLRRFVEAGVPVLMVPGNHDASSLRLHPYRDLARAPFVSVQTERSGRRGTAPGGDRAPAVGDAGGGASGAARAHILARPRFEAPVSVETAAGPLHVYGIAFDRAECADPLAGFRRSEVDGVHVLLLHAALQDASHWAGSPDSLRIAPEPLRACDVDYIALGDYHRFRPPAEMPEGVPACYSGSFAATDLTEPGPRGYALVELEPGQPPRVELRDAGVAPVVDLGEHDVAGSRNEVEVASTLAERVPDDGIPVVRLVGEPDFPLDAERVAAELRARFGHTLVRDATRYYEAGRLDELSRADTIAGHVVRLGRRRIEAAGDEEARAAAQRALRITLRALGVE